MKMVDFERDTELSDTELDRLLQHASTPVPRSDFEARLLTKLTFVDNSNKVIAFPQRKRPSWWLAGLPLAASLVLGIWLGANGTTVDFLPFSTESAVQNDTALLSTQSADDFSFLIEDNLS